MSKHFKAYTTTFESPDTIDDADQVYGDGDAFPDIDDPCEVSPNGQHEFNCLTDPDICIHCKRWT